MLSTENRDVFEKVEYRFHEWSTAQRLLITLDYRVQTHRALSAIKDDHIGNRLHHNLTYISECLHDSKQCPRLS